MRPILLLATAAALAFASPALAQGAATNGSVTTTPGGVGGTSQTGVDRSGSAPRTMDPNPANPSQSSPDTAGSPDTSDQSLAVNGGQGAVSGASESRAGKSASRGDARDAKGASQQGAASAGEQSRKPAS